MRITHPWHSVKVKDVYPVASETSNYAKLNPTQDYPITSTLTNSLSQGTFFALVRGTLTQYPASVRLMPAVR